MTKRLLLILFLFSIATLGRPHVSAESAHSAEKAGTPALTSAWVDARSYGTDGALQAAVAAAPAGGWVVVPPGDYTIASTITINKPLTMMLSPAATLTVNSKAGIAVQDATGVRITGGKFVLSGPKVTGITCVGTVSNLTIEGVTVVGSGAIADAQSAFYNVSGQRLSNIRIIDNTIRDVAVGISLNADLAGSISDVLIQGNHLSNLIGLWNSPRQW
jgi:nitrous oxidase accessory protein NosD